MNPKHSEQLAKLFSHLPNPRERSIGIAAKDVARIVITPQLGLDILGCLESDDNLEVVFGLFFLENLGARSEFRMALGSSSEVVLTLIRKLLNHPSNQVRVGAVNAFVAFRSECNDYVSVMLKLLHSPDFQINSVAIGAAPTFLTAKNLNELLRFQDEPSYGETGGMGGPMRYTLRDFALEMAERVAGQSFDAGDCFERCDGGQVSWRSWSAFTTWLDGRKKRSLFS